MKEFKDKANRSWSIDVNGETVKRVQGLTGILLMELITGPAAQKIVDDPLIIMHVLWACCKPEAEERKVEESAFLAGFSGDALDDAVKALMDEVVSFFPKSRRTMAQKLLDKGNAIQAEAVRQATAELDSMTPEMMIQKMKEQSDKEPGNSSGNSPALSASIPAGSRSET